MNEIQITEESFNNYKNFLISVYPRISNKEFKESWEEVQFCSGKIEDFQALTLIRFLSGKGLTAKIPQIFIDDEQKWNEKLIKFELNTNTDEAILELAKDFDVYMKNTPDMSNILYDYTIDENFKIEDIMTKELALEFFKHYNLDLEYWSK